VTGDVMPRGLIIEDGAAPTPERTPHRRPVAGSPTPGARTAPFRAVLKNDQLAMALKDADAIVLPGGSATVDQQKLDAASFRFIGTSRPEECRDGRQLHRVHRYQFDADHKLRGTTDHDYCGAPPNSACK
jgi:hypothetical protein